MSEVILEVKHLCTSFLSESSSLVSAVSCAIGSFSGVYSIKTLPVCKLCSMFVTDSCHSIAARNADEIASSFSTLSRNRIRPGKKLEIVISAPPQSADASRSY